MEKTTIIRYAGTLAAAVSLLQANTSPLYAMENFQNESSSILTDSVEEEAEKEALKRVNDYAITIYESEYFDANIDPKADFIVGPGFYQYFVRDGGLEKSEAATFPVYQNNQPVFTIDVAEDDGEWFSSAGTEWTDQLSEILTKPGTYVAKLYKDQGIKAFELAEEEQPVGVSEKASVATTASLPKNKTVKNRIFDILNASRPLGIGFSTDQPNHKEIRMDNCIVIQPRDANGYVLGLCWAASSGTIIRQQTGNRTIDAWQIANEAGIAPGTGVGIEISRQIMMNHGCTAQYQPVSWPARDYTEVMHNINNQYPIYMECRSATPGVGHAVTLTGYNNSAGQQALQYFDGAENGFRCTIYQGNSTKISSFSADYYWDRSILIPLY